MGRPSAASARICAPRARSRAPCRAPAAPQARRLAPRLVTQGRSPRAAAACPCLSMPHRRAAPPPVPSAM
eukprot:771094-Prymnesium_polylepis.1